MQPTNAGGPEFRCVAFFLEAMRNVGFLSSFAGDLHAVRHAPRRSVRLRKVMAWRGLQSSIAGLALMAGAACGAGTEPATTPLDVRSTPGDTAVLFGWVYHPAPPSTPWSERHP